jgi:endonuclease YncB( thermonuclease family)
MPQGDTVSETETYPTITTVWRRAVEHVRPPPQLPLSQWLERHLRLPTGLAAEGGPIRLWPTQRGIADALADPSIERVTLVKSARSGFTTLLTGLIAHHVLNDPAPIIAVLPTESDCRDYITSDIEPIFAASPDLRGDTLKSADAEVGLYGIDAPELDQTCTDANGKDWPCGRDAQAKLKALVARRAVDCAPQARDKFNRIVAVCRTSAAPDLGEGLVREGLAVNCGGDAEGLYSAAEADAQAVKRGLWHGTFENPADWRQAHPRDGD